MDQGICQRLLLLGRPAAAHTLLVAWRQWQWEGNPHSGARQHHGGDLHNLQQSPTCLQRGEAW